MQRGRHSTNFHVQNHPVIRGLESMPQIDASRSPTPLRGENEKFLGEGEEDDEDSRLEAALRGELKAEAAKAEDSQVGRRIISTYIRLHLFGQLFPVNSTANELFI